MDNSYFMTQHPLRGAALFLCGLFLFACMDTSIKFLSGHYPPPMIVAIRYLVHAFLMLAVLGPSQGRKLVQTTRTGLVIVRAGCLAAASLLFAFAMKRMPVAEGTSLLFVAPMVVMLLAGPLLKERVGLTGWLATAAGFGGVLLVARPGGGLDPIGVVLALCAACMTSTYQVLSRVLATTETTLAMLFYTALVGSIAFGLALPWTVGGDSPTPLHLLLFLGIGAAGGVGHYLFTAAHRNTPASALAPLQYGQLVWAGLLGWIVFGHVPDLIAIIGMIVIAVAGATVALRSRFAAKALEEAAET